mgnify:CR=1 FL=1
MTTIRPHLQSLIVELTQRCNHACQHCYNVWYGSQGKHYPRGELTCNQTLDMLTKALDETICQHVTLTGGEPMLREDLPLILTFLRKRHVRVTLISNGHLLDARTVHSLVEGGIHLFEIPLLSHQRELHDDLSGSSGAWQAVLSAMTHIRNQRGQVVISFVATRRNISHLHQVIRLAFAFGARGLMLNRFNPGGRGREHFEELLPSIDQVRQALETAESAVKEYGLPISCSIPIQPCLIDTSCFPHLGFGYCAAGGERAYYTLDPLGNLRPCNHSDLILGNLFDEAFPALISPERLSCFTSATPAYCRDCSRRTECQGGCKASAQVCYGSLELEEPFLTQRTNQTTPVSLAD